MKLGRTWWDKWGLLQKVSTRFFHSVTRMPKVFTIARQQGDRTTYSVCLLFSPPKNVSNFVNSPCIHTFITLTSVREPEKRLPERPTCVLIPCTARSYKNTYLKHRITAPTPNVHLHECVCKYMLTIHVIWTMMF